MGTIKLSWAILVTMAASFIPGLEMRAGIPVGIAMGLPVAVAVAAAIAGNLLQVPLAVIVVEWAYRRSAAFPRLKRWLDRAEAAANKHRRWIQRYGWIGLGIFVLLPVPGSGVFGGMVIARLLQMRATGVWLGISLGIAATGLVLGLGAHGALRLFHLVAP